jgi:hypothetical protein
VSENGEEFELLLMGDGPGSSLGPRHRLLALAARWNRGAQHLPNPLTGYPKLQIYRSLVPPLDQHGTTHPTVKFQLDIPRCPMNQVTLATTSKDTSSTVDYVYTATSCRSSGMT